MRSVDVVVPCYNYAKYLEICVRSILDQPDVAVRVLIIDDCSTDDSEGVGRRLAASDSRVFYRRHEKNIGHIATYNEGLLGWVTADYCLLISADDLLTPAALSRAVQVLEEHPGVGMCCGAQIVFSDVPDLDSQVAAGEPVRIASGADFWAETCRTGQNAVATPTAVVRTGVQQAAGAYRSELPHSGDLEMWLRIASRSDVSFLSSYQACKRMHGSNMQVAYLKHLLGDLLERNKAFESALAECADRLPQPEKLRQEARRSLAMEALWAASSELDHGRHASAAECLAASRSIDSSVLTCVPWWKVQAKRAITKVTGRRAS